MKLRSKLSEKLEGKYSYKFTRKGGVSLRAFFGPTLKFLNSAIFWSLKVYILRNAQWFCHFRSISGSTTGLNMGLKANFGEKCGFFSIQRAIVTDPFGGQKIPSSMFIRDVRVSLWPIFVDVKLCAHS